MSQVAKSISSFTQQDVNSLFKNAHVKARIPGLRVLTAPALIPFGRILVITKARVGNAPQRNLIRRRLKSIFYEEKFYKNKLDCIVIVQREAIDTSFHELKKILNRALYFTDIITPIQTHTSITQFFQ